LEKLLDAVFLFSDSAIQRFSDSAIQHLDDKKILTGMGEFFIIIACEVLAMCLNIYFSGLLCLRWRKWLTHHYIDHWVDHDHSHASTPLDNPAMAFNLFMGFFFA